VHDAKHVVAFANSVPDSKIAKQRIAIVVTFLIVVFV
jgi:hypothetical protein